MSLIRLAHCPQVGQSAEVTQVVGDGTWLSTAEAAELLGVSTSYVIKLIDETKELSAMKVGNRRRILRAVAEAYRDEQLRQAGGQ